MTSGVFAFAGMCDSFSPRRASDRESGSGDVAAERKHVIRFSQGAQGEGGKVAHTDWTRARTSERHHSMVWGWGFLGVIVPIAPQHGRTICRTAEQKQHFLHMGGKACQHTAENEEAHRYLAGREHV